MKGRITTKPYEVGDLVSVNGRLHRIVAVVDGDRKACLKGLLGIASSRKGYG